MCLYLEAFYIRATYQAPLKSRG